MPRSTFLALFLLFAAGAPAPAQEPAEDPELAFVHKLRERRYADLALEYLEKRLSKNPRYAGKPELALEIALARLDQATTEPDSSRRLALFARARAEFEDFLKKNANHPRAGEAQLQIAEVAVLQGKTQLNRALAAAENDPTREDEFAKARKLLAEARKELNATLPKLPDKEKPKANLKLALLALSEVRTFTNEDAKGRDDALQTAKTQLNKVIDGLNDVKDPIRLRALAWLGRAYSLEGAPTDATKRLNEAKAGGDPIAHRLADYFELLNDFEDQARRGGNPAPKDITAMITRANAWRRKYAPHLNTDEGHGTQYILAKEFFLRGLQANATDKKTAWDYSRQLLSSLEGNDNEFATRARELRIEILRGQNAFTRKLNTLITFEDNYIRAVYEHQQFNKDPKKEFEKPEARKAKQQEIVQILRKALTAAEGEIKRNRRPPTADLHDAYYKLAGYEESLGHLKESADVGEEFARKYPKAKQAPLTAIYAAVALQRLIRKDAGEESEWNMAAERERLYQLARFMVDRWPGAKPGTFGRYLIVNYLITKPLAGQNDDAKKVEKEARQQEALKLGGDLARYEIARDRAKTRHFLDAVRLLEPVKPDFSNYAGAQYQLALAALQIDEDIAQRKKGGEWPLLFDFLYYGIPFKQLALTALEKIPDPPLPPSTPALGVAYLQAKIKLGFLLYGVKKFDEMEKLGKKLVALLPRLKLESVVSEAQLKGFQQAAESIVLYALYGKAEADYRAGHFVKVADQLDPLVKEIAAGKYTELKENQRLLTGLLGMSFRSNLQAERLQRGMEIIEVWKGVEKDNKDLIPNILKQTVAILKKQVEELRKKKDKDRLDKTVSGFSAFLDRVGKDPKSLTPDFMLLLAQSYAGIGKYDKALELLDKFLKQVKVPDAKATPQQAAPYRLARTLQIHTLRLKGKENNDKKSLDQASKLMDEIMGTEAKPGWGKRDLSALVEQLYVFRDLGFYGAAVNRGNALLKILLPKLAQGGAMRDRYFEVYFLFVECYYKYGQGKKTPAERTTAIAKAAQYYLKLETNQPTLGGEESKKRFEDLFESKEGAELKAAVEVLRKSGAGAAGTGARKK